MSTIRQSKTDWKRLEKMSDDEIDFSDIPELDAQFFQDATIVMPKRKDVNAEHEPQIEIDTERQK